MSLLAWHFLPADKRLRYDDNRLVRVGRPLSVKDRTALRLCCYGMHASVRLGDALANARGPIICRVRLTGRILCGDDKVCAETRTVLWMADATRTLREHALWCAEQVLPIWSQRFPEDQRPKLAIETARRHLDGMASDQELRDADAVAAYAHAYAAYAADAADAHAYAAYAYAYAYAAYAADAADAAYKAGLDHASIDADLLSRINALAPKERRTSKGKPS